MAKTIQKPKLLQYLDVVHYLNDFFAFKKALDPNYSYTAWAIEIGLGSKTALRFILKRQRKISPNTQKLLKKQIGLDEIESSYFDGLVSYSQSKTEQERQSFGAMLIKLQRKSYQPTPLIPEQGVHHVLSPLILTLLEFNDVVGTKENLSYLLSAPEDIVEACLEQLRTDEVVFKKNGRFYFSGHGFRIADKPNSIHLRRFHEFWIDRAKEAIDLPAHSRKFRALKIALNDSEFDSVIEKINEFAVVLLSKYQFSNLEERRVYILETLLFPVSQFNSAESKVKSSDAEKNTESIQSIPSQAI